MRFFDYQIGGSFKALGCQADLKGRHSQFEVYNGYLGFGDDLLDISYMAQHFGAHSQSKILAKALLVTEPVNLQRDLDSSLVQRRCGTRRRVCSDTQP